MNRKSLTRLLTHIGKYKRFLILSMICALLSVTASLLGPMLIGWAIDYMVGKGAVNFSFVSHILIALAFIYAGGNLFGWLLTYLTNTIAYRTVNDMRGKLFEKLGTLPLKFYDNTPYGDTINRFVNDMDSISDGVQQGIMTLFTGIVTVFGAVGLMLYINPFMTVFVLLSAPGAFFVARFISKRTQHFFKEQAKILGQLNGYAEEIIGGQKVVKAFGFEERSFRKFQDTNNLLYKVGVKAQFYSSLTNPSTRLVNNITYAGIGIIGSVAAISGIISVGGISSFLIYASLFGKPFNEISGVLAQRQAAFASLQRIFYVLDLPSEAMDDKNSFDMKESEGNILFKNVDFSYEPECPLIRGFNLEVKKGDRIAIVGQTGAGKTTLVNLLMRFYDVDSGSILIDGINIKAITRASLRRNFGMVLQDTWLFAGSIRDNIAYGRENATEEQIIAAAKAAEAHSFIMRLPKGYDTLINDTGENLSQGQKQLLTIARVMLVDPPILILDEATSSIDTRTEIHIQKAFMKMIAGRTSFVIAHRLSTIREADMILVMDKGNVVESGTHEQLLKKNGHYTMLYKSQFEPA
ncbi:ABC transporter ATP-binding protein [Pseudobacteroides cellulosolvens]|uniref:Xenobiotic-transporting ATPase n=1 Tax=Pseudobacteroides cellulosolvens ATCC 35603 = DSM 2933 TaxID=398512 RepID=A0A0L6JKA3_9FIRM|nr:ABC transporter ATP-binding protein [Pseudobacteroides cellulosolvens]KNY25797.1 Xenobiotic-transporting ATPase [Pseudobacteroides cellulosolvens ATCC 35603 = DSM 2933]